MSDLSDLGTTRANVLPGYVLTRFGIEDYGACEEEFARRHLAVVAKSTVGLPSAVADRVLSIAQTEVSGGAFNYGRYGYECQAHARVNLPFILYRCLVPKHPTMTPEQAGALLTEENRNGVQRAVLELSGFTFGADAKKADPAAPPETPSTGNPSTDSSAPVDSLTSRSAA